MKTDLQDREDVKVLINHFYQRLLADEEMMHFFEDIDLIDHMPILYDFWESVLFQAGKYKRNTFEKHLELHIEKPIQAEHLERWVKHFTDSVNDHFEGPKAEHAKNTARSVASIIKAKLDNFEQWRIELNN
ncbi:MAG: group III truncated hemoglobin [Bacteroidota bacterium]